MVCFVVLLFICSTACRAWYHVVRGSYLGVEWILHTHKVQKQRHWNGMNEECHKMKLECFVGLYLAY